MLALLSVAHGAHEAAAGDAEPATPLLVFDEIDAGIGGHTARAVGEHLRALAEGRQILCITHLPQVAALGVAPLHDRQGHVGAAGEDDGRGARRRRRGRRARPDARGWGGRPRRQPARPAAVEGRVARAVVEGRLLAGCRLSARGRCAPAAVIGGWRGKRRWEGEGSRAPTHPSRTCMARQSRPESARPVVLCMKSMRSTTGLGSGAGVDVLCRFSVTLSAQSRRWARE